MSLCSKPQWSDEELDLYRDTVVRFVESELVPNDEEARKRGHVGREIWKRAGDLGILCTDIPEEYGGAGADFRYEAVLYEEMAARSLTSFCPSIHTIAAHYLLNHGTEEQKSKYLPAMVSGEMIGAIGFTEPGAGSDLQGIRTRAELKGEHYLVNGSKTFITNGYLADILILALKTDTSLGAKGVSLLIVETKHTPGFSVGKVLDKIGLKGQDTSELFFSDAEVPAVNLLGGVEGQGFKQLMSDLPYERLIIGVMAVAMMEGALAATIDYVKERKAFNASISSFQNTRYKLAELKALTVATRSFMDKCVIDLVAGELDTETASMAKMWGSEAQCKVVDECLQLFGGYGYMNEYMIGRMYTDARLQKIYGGTNEIMKEIIARAMFC